MKISKEFDAIVGFAREEAMRTGSYSIGADHLFLGILRHADNAAVAEMRSQGIDTADCKRRIDSLTFHEHSIPYCNEDDIRLGSDGSSAVNLAIAEAMAEGAEEAGAIHLLKAICKQEGNHSGEYLRGRGFRCTKPSTGKPGQEENAATAARKEFDIMLSAINLNKHNTIVS